MSSAPPVTANTTAPPPTSPTSSSFVRGTDWDISLWCGMKKPLPGTTQSHQLSVTVAPPPPPPAVNGHADNNDDEDEEVSDFAVCEILECPRGLLTALCPQKAHAGKAVAEAAAAQRNSDPRTSTASAAAAFGIDELLVMTPGNFAAAEMYANFVHAVRQKHPTRGVLVIGHAGIQAQDRNGRIRFRLSDYINLTAQFYQHVAMTDICAEILSSSHQEPQQRQGDGGEIQQQQQQTAVAQRRKTKLFAGAHSVGAYILEKALDQVTQVPRWDKYVQLDSVLMWAPVIQNFEKAPAADGTQKWVNPVTAGVVAYAAVLPFWLLPKGSRTAFFETFSGANTEFAEMLANIARPSAVWNILGLVRDAYKVILDLKDDAPFLNALGPRLKCYYCKNDGWVPTEYVAAFKALVPKAIVIEEQDEKVTHSCCVTQPKESGAVF